MIKHYGSLNSHSVGIVMKEILRRVIGLIRNKRFTFEVYEKVGYSGKLDDLVTDADKEAQKMCVKLLQENFPGFGIIAEEAGEDGIKLRIPALDMDGVQYWFTIDPLDGTKAWTRKQSDGIGSMMSLVKVYADGRANEIISVFIGDIMTQEIYGFRPDSHKVHRISEYEVSRDLTWNKSRLLSDNYLLLRENPLNMTSDLVRAMAGDKSLFKSLLVSSGSIGIHFARLWKGEVAAILLPESNETPWDNCPVTGISMKMGFAFYEIKDGVVKMVSPNTSLEERYRDSKLLVIHECYERELTEWIIETVGGSLI